ncbi:MAG: aldehyde dehydrogenase family protein, partial [Rubripirellula sp.]|nr:aldehyde dehydrogenase family protein [Rubripirellula sp.]
SIADQLLVGSVTINDLIVPTADPRVPFGGRGESGFGVTRGEEGLLEMTVPKLKSIRKSKVVAHLIFNREEDAKTLLATNKMLHASSFASKIKGLFAVMQSVKRTR